MMCGSVGGGSALSAGLRGCCKEQFVPGSNIVAMPLLLSGAETALFIVLSPLGENDPRLLGPTRNAIG